VVCCLVRRTDILLKYRTFPFFVCLHWCLLDSCLQSKFRSEKIGYSVVGKCQSCIKYARADNKGSIISSFHPYLLLLSRGKILPFTKLVKYWLVVNLHNPEAVWRVFIPEKLSGPDHRSVWRKFFRTPPVSW